MWTKRFALRLLPRMTPVTASVPLPSAPASCSSSLDASGNHAISSASTRARVSRQMTPRGSRSPKLRTRFIASDAPAEGACRRSRDGKKWRRNEWSDLRTCVTAVAFSGSADTMPRTAPSPMPRLAMERRHVSPHAPTSTVPEMERMTKSAVATASRLAMRSPWAGVRNCRVARGFRRLWRRGRVLTSANPIRLFSS